MTTTEPTCECSQPGFCERRGCTIPGIHFRKCQAGQVVVLDQLYADQRPPEKFTGLQGPVLPKNMPEGVHGNSKNCGISEPVGTALKVRIEKLITVKTGKGCGCQNLVVDMDKWGIAGSVQRREEIITHLVNNRDVLVESLRTHGTLGHAAGLVAGMLPDIMLRAGAGLLLDQAIADVQAAKTRVGGGRGSIPGVTIKTSRKIGTVTQPADVVRIDGWWNDAAVQPADVVRADGWWNDAAVQAGHRDRATAFITTIPRYPGHFDGRGIVITGGGRYFVSAYVTIRVIRHVGCTLPIELWYLDGEMDDEMIDMVAEHGGTCHNASELARGTNYFLDHWWKGWQLKAFALLHSSFREVLMLDADCYPVRDPSFVFDWPEYHRTGAIIWPDVGASAKLFPKTAAKVLGVPQFTEGAAESGQLVANKERVWQALCLAKHFNADARFIYKIIYGDKDTFPVALHRIGLPYSRMSPNCKMNGPGIHQLDERGAVLFNHRIHDKFRIFNERFDSTSQRGTTQQFFRDWQHEDFCHSVLTELNDRWGTT